MENQEEMWMKYMQQRTENSRDFLNRTGLVFGVGFGPGAQMISAPLFGMMLTSAQTGVFDIRDTVAAPAAAPAPAPNLMLNLWNMALNNPGQQMQK